VAHDIVTVSEVVLVAVTVTILWIAVVTVDCVTPPENESVADLGTLKMTIPEPPVAEVPL
jgi:hypothetical protein